MKMINNEFVTLPVEQYLDALVGLPVIFDKENHILEGYEITDYFQSFGYYEYRIKYILKYNKSRYGGNSYVTAGSANMRAIKERIRPSKITLTDIYKALTVDNS